MLRHHLVPRRARPDWVADWKGARPDSKSPIDAARELIAWWRARGRDPHDKLIVLSDAMDVDTIEDAARALRGAVNLSIGWGTNLTNDFKGCAPAGVDGELAAISLVCKVVEADGRPAVKLSDNPNKVMGPRAEIERYIRVFGAEGMAPAPVDAGSDSKPGPGERSQAQGGWTIADRNVGAAKGALGGNVCSSSYLRRSATVWRCPSSSPRCRSLSCWSASACCAGRPGRPRSPG